MILGLGCHIFGHTPPSNKTPKRYSNTRDIMCPNKTFGQILDPTFVLNRILGPILEPILVLNLTFNIRPNTLADISPQLNIRQDT